MPILCLGGCRIIPNLRVVLSQLPSYPDPQASVSILPVIPKTPSNSAGLLHLARQAKPLLKKTRHRHHEELAQFIDSLAGFAINQDKNVQLERDINQKGQTAQTLKAPNDHRTKISLWRKGIGCTSLEGAI